MKKMILVFMLPAFLLGCAQSNKPKDAVIKINNYEISKAELNRQFKDSSFARLDTPQSRKDFLDNLIDRVLILQDAQKNNLDNDPRFLKMVENFWMQSLLRLALERKSKEIIGASFVSDREVEEAYQGMLKDGKAAKPYEMMYQGIKRDLTSFKETRMLSQWLTQLHKDADIQVNKDLIPKDK
jgi:hypothetical protein